MKRSDFDLPYVLWSLKTGVIIALGSWIVMQLLLWLFTGVSPMTIWGI